MLAPGAPPGHLVPLVAVASACAPDLDLLLHLVLGPQHHRGPSHSVGAAALAGLAVFAAARLGGATGVAARLGLLAGAGWLSHVLLDWLGSDSRAPFGIMALWPFERSYFVAPFALFMDVGRELTWRTMGQNMVAAAWESVVLWPLLWLTRRRGSA
jgi:membrane-bound metal-dependent hydrolase YbcI (DUF457 family)